MTATPIYDGLVAELGDPRCSPVEALVTYSSRNDFTCNTWVELFLCIAQVIR